MTNRNQEVQVDLDVEESRVGHTKIMYAIREAADAFDKKNRESIRKNLESFFKEADGDDDGTLTLTELTKALRKQGYKGNETEIGKFFKIADSSGDSQISFDEYLRVMGDAPMRLHSKAAMRKVFSCFDRDGNGKIDKKELMSVFGELGKLFSEEDVQNMIDIADADHSGALEYEEFIEIVTGVDP